MTGRGGGEVPSRGEGRISRARSGGGGEVKDRHIRICLSADVEASASNGLRDWELVGGTVDFNMDDLDTSTTIFGRRLRLPLLISSMTGGGLLSDTTNLRLAEAAQEAGLAMAVGSQKLMLEEPAAAASFQVRHVAPDVLLFADLGLVHLNYGLDRIRCLRAVEEIEADALMLYYNPLHEATQPAGDLDFRGLFDKLAELAGDFPYPIVVKEVGFGLPEAILQRLSEPPLGDVLSGVDVAGLGGTHWGRVEALLAGRAPGGAEEELGVATADSLVAAARLLPARMVLIGSGGVRNGVEVAKVVALGADAAGMALPFLRWAAESTERVLQGAAEIERELRLAMWFAGAPDLPALRGRVRRRRED